MPASSDVARLSRLIEVGRTVLTELDLESVLRRVLSVAREVTGARYAAVGILNEERDGLERFITEGIDAETHRVIGDLPRGRGVLGVLIEDPQPLRLADVGGHPKSYGFPPAHPPMHTFLGVPIRIRGEVWGNLYLTEKEGGEFTEADEESTVILSDWAAIAIQTAKSVEEDRLRHTIEAAEQERRYWARELHDETLQGLAGIRLLLSSALERDPADAVERPLRQALEHTESQIEALRTLITELRPAALDELGLAPAVESLVDRAKVVGGLEIDLSVDLAEAATRLAPHVENTAYRLVQEAISNVIKHARAETVRIALTESDSRLAVTVEDDGLGFDADTQQAGFGLTGMRERVTLARGSLEVSSVPGSGTTVSATLPAEH